jgi:hypothetical protein
MPQDGILAYKTTYEFFASSLKYKANTTISLQLTGMKMRPVETRPQLSFFGGRQGPDMYAALKGELGAETIKAWNADKKAEIVKGVGEVATLLKDAQPAADN